MDPISQGTVAAAFAQTPASREKITSYAWLGALAGMAPDLDIFIQSSTDPILFLEYHRHFTHSLVFIPIGAAIVALCLGRFAKTLSWREAYIACFIGYATHGLLDACTSYGTQLFWPFSDMRIAWNNISVVDPLFTLPSLALVITAIWRKNPRYTYAAIIWMFFYFALGVAQHLRALDAAHNLATQRGHEPLRLTAKPGFGSLVLWKSIYEHEGRYYVDAVRVTTQSMICPGESIEKLDVAKTFPTLSPTSQQAKDIERFRWFSDDYLAPFTGPLGTGYVIDVRYANVPNQIDPLWGIRINTGAGSEAHVEFWPNRRVEAAQRNAMGRLFDGSDCKAVR